MKKRLLFFFLTLSATVALVAFVSAYRLDVGRLADLPSIVGDRGAAPTLRLAGLLDMSAYLAIAPVVASPAWYCANTCTMSPGFRPRCRCLMLGRLDGVLRRSCAASG